jgi:hypothetical protein
MGDLQEWMERNAAHMGHMSTNDAEWPKFDGKYVNYPLFIKDWWAYRRTNHGTAGDSLVDVRSSKRCGRRFYRNR